MFFMARPEAERLQYINYLKIVGALSRLFSESDVPYLYYRASENIFCKAFSADNYSRTDCSFDAGKLIAGRKYGIGIKTFLENRGSTFQKVAEFNKDKSSYDSLKVDPKQLIRKVSELRNTRISFAKNLYKSSDEIYHCILRSKETFKIYESTMDCVNIDGISSITVNSNENVINFEDGLNAYKFNLPKSTLFKRFDSSGQEFSFAVEIVEDPYELLSQLFSNEPDLEVYKETHTKKPFVILPLFSTKLKPRQVAPKAGLNLWNATGRSRDPNEIEIRIPRAVNKKFELFFPPKDTRFNLILPNGENLDAKICQEGRKALMSNPNKDLGKWLLRDVLKLNEGELVSHEKLLELGVDSVCVTKNSEDEFAIDFKKTGTFDVFSEKFLK